MYDPNFPPPVSSQPLVPPPPPIAVKHSGLGIASFIMGILVIIGVCITFGVAGGSANVSTMDTSYDSLMTGIGLLACGTIAVALVGLVLGIIAVVQKNTKKVFGIIGLVLNALVFLGLCGVIAIGMIANSA